MTVTSLLATFTIAEDISLQLALKLKVFFIYTIFPEQWQDTLETKLQKQNICHGAVSAVCKTLQDILHFCIFYVKKVIRFVRVFF